MKNFKRAILLLMAVVVFMANCTMFVYADVDVEDAQGSVVFIGTTVRFSASNNGGITFTRSFGGTGFAVGKPGKPVQYIATCAHCVQEPEGVYAVYIDDNGYLIDCILQDKGTAYPQQGRGTYGGRSCTVYVDYFEPQTVELYAMFSQSSNDYTTLTVTQINQDVDVALCKLASDPTTKISARPLQLSESVKLKTEVLAVGYAGTSDLYNAEKRLDSTDSTLEDGIISKKQRTNGMFGSKTTYDVYEVTAELKKGMSGGPVFSEKSGAIVGITAFGNTDYTQSAGSRYAICVDYLVEMLDSEGIQYEIYKPGLPVWLTILLIIVALIVLAAVVYTVFIMYNKKQAENAIKLMVNENAASASVSQCHLIGVSGVFAGRKFGVEKRAVIGRDSAKCNVVFPIDQPGVSGVHCELEVENGVITLKDCGSSFGTFLSDGTKLEPNIPTIIKPGNSFYVGAKENVFEVRN